MKLSIPALTMALALPATSFAQVLMNETFPNQTAVDTWTRADTLGGTLTQTYVNDATLGDSMQVDPDTKGQSLQKNLSSSFTLSGTGDSLSLTMTYRQDVVQGGGLRIGFFDAAGEGYWANIGTPTSGSGTSSLQRQDDETVSPFTSSTTLGSTVATGFAASTSADQTVSFSLTRNGSSGLDVFTSWTTPNVGGDPTSISRTDASPTAFTFSRVVLGFGSDGTAATAVYSVTDITVNAIPEPSSALLIGLAGVALMAVRRRRA